MAKNRGKGRIETKGKPSDGRGYSTEHRIHQLCLAFLYCLAFAIAWVVLSRAEITATFVALLSAGAILATFGSAISALGTMWERDLIERVKTNIDIFFKDIVKQEEAWRRWPFLPRRSKKLALDNNFHLGELRNPEIPLDVGSHFVTAEVPTVLDDFFDLSVLKNYMTLRRFRRAAGVAWTRRDKDTQNPENGMLPINEYMAYECLFDVWRSIFRFRIARYTAHLGAGLTLFSASLVMFRAIFA